MKIDKTLVVGLLIGIILGVAVAAELSVLANDRACPKDICLGASEIVPISDKGYFPKVHEALTNAKKSIHITAFELMYYPTYKSSDENVIINDLVEAHDRGIEVEILLDQYSGQQGNSTNAYSYLKKKGLNVKYDSPDTTTHAKLVIVDGKMVILGSTNFSYTSLEMNNEVDVMLFSEDAARYYEHYFQKLWSENK